MKRYNILLGVDRIIKKFLCLFLFSRKSRRNLRRNVDKIMVPTMVKAIKSCLKDHFSDYWAFVPFWPWGDFLICCALLEEFKKEHKGKILIFYVNSEQLKFIKALGVADKIIKLSPEVYYALNWQNPDFPHNEEGLKKGCLFEMSHMTYNQASLNKTSDFGKLYSNMLELKSTRFAVPKLSQKTIEKVENIYQEISCGKKVIMLTPHAKSYDEHEISAHYWLKLARQLEQMGYLVVFNSRSKRFEEFENVFLSMIEQAYFATLCYANISIRSGFTDVMTIMGVENQIILYPESMRFITITEEEQIKEMTRCFNFNQNLTFRENMFNFTSVNNMYGKNFKEIVIEYVDKNESIINSLECKGELRKYEYNYKKQ